MPDWDYFLDSAAPVRCAGRNPPRFPPDYDLYSQKTAMCFPPRMTLEPRYGAMHIPPNTKPRQPHRGGCGSMHEPPSVKNHMRSRIAYPHLTTPTGRFRSNPRLQNDNSSNATVAPRVIRFGNHVITSPNQKQMHFLHYPPPTGRMQNLHHTYRLNHMISIPIRVYALSLKESHVTFHTRFRRKNSASAP